MRTLSSLFNVPYGVVFQHLVILAAHGQNVRIKRGRSFYKGSVDSHTSDALPACTTPSSIPVSLRENVLFSNNHFTMCNKAKTSPQTSVKVSTNSTETFSRCHDEKQLFFVPIEAHFSTFLLICYSALYSNHRKVLREKLSLSANRRKTLAMIRSTTKTLALQERKARRAF